ncbi:MAG: hypothetical protein Q8M20_13995 [Rhodocyclaceae bacterium]|nr:hypothetical protein [Rhodocyclaceae bacterium]MDZ4216112.1 hypothetical protein [Rhodocyclaceae bacterium]
MNFDLPPTDSDQPPAFVDVAPCRAWLAQMPVSNPVQAQAHFLRQLHLLNRYTLDGTTRLAMLEMLRETICFVQDESAKKYAGKPLPLAPPEQAALDSAHGLWQALATGYLRCLEACDSDAGLKGQAALICQRALATRVDNHIDLVRAGMHPAPAHWRLVHRIYAAAEALGVANVAVADALRTDKPQTPMAAYAEQMLLAAANLHELTPRHQTWVMRWARRWAPKLVVQPTPPPFESRALPLCVDLDSNQPPAFKPFAGAGARFLDTAELRKSLKGRIELLARGAPEDTPARLGLGEDCPQPACEELLRRLYPRWVKGGMMRRHDRQGMQGACRFVVGVDAIHYYLSNHQPFKSPGQLTSEELRRQREELATFGRIAERFEDEYSRNHGYQLENWEVIEDWGLLNQSNGGLRLVRPLKQPGGRLAVGQLIAVQHSGASGLVLGVVRWAQIVSEELISGVQLYPGKSWPVAVRGTGVMAARESYKPGFVLPAVPALEQPDSIILPPGSFKPERIMEAWTAEGAVNVKLKALLDRGADFEWASYVEVAPR